MAAGAAARVAAPLTTSASRHCPRTPAIPARTISTSQITGAPAPSAADPGADRLLGRPPGGRAAQGSAVACTTRAATARARAPSHRRSTRSASSR